MFFKQLAIAIGIMIVLIGAIVFLNKKTEKYTTGSNPYQVLDYVNNRKGFNSQQPIYAKK